MKIKPKRVYNISEEDTGIRILVDKMWPRGFSKEKLRLDYWAKELAPSNELRKWYHDNFDKWDDFKLRYAKELSIKKDLLEDLVVRIKDAKEVLFLYSSKEEKFNNARALKEYIEHTIYK